MNEFFGILSNSYIAHVILRLLLASLFGTLIGLEREHAKRPAGLRTHLLVCVGSCLVMLTAEFIYSEYHQFSPNMDVARLGAQVISGVGFLGAGTIIRNGNSVKGLTTAASLWAVACVGLATGIGYYFGATIATLLIFLFLAYFKSIAVNASDHIITQEITLKVLYSSALMDKITNILTNTKSININNVRFKSDKENNTLITLQLALDENISLVPFLKSIYDIPEVYEIGQKNDE